MIVGMRTGEYKSVRNKGEDFETYMEGFTRIIGGRTFDFYRGYEPGSGRKFILVYRRDTIGHPIRHHFTNDKF